MKEKGLLDGFDNAVCEVKTMDNELIFQGRLTRIEQEDGENFIEVSLRQGNALPVYPYGTRLKIDCMAGRKGMRSLGGVLYIANEKFWRITEISELTAFERRGFFRINARGNANITPVSDKTSVYPARLVNISLSGLLLETPLQLYEGEQIQISHLRFDGFNVLFNFKAVVKRIVSSGNVQRYGCSFVDPKTADIDNLCGVIFQLQRDMIKARRSI